jgi:hypothetical protein
MLILSALQGPAEYQQQRSGPQQPTPENSVSACDTCSCSCQHMAAAHPQCSWMAWVENLHQKHALTHPLASLCLPALCSSLCCGWAMSGAVRAHHKLLGSHGPQLTLLLWLCRYHLKLKQELEELRHEATVLLRERFHLQQCIRCSRPASNSLPAHYNAPFACLAGLDPFVANYCEMSWVESYKPLKQQQRVYDTPGTVHCCGCRYLKSRCDDPMLLDRQNPTGSASKRPGGVRLQPASLTGSVLYSSPLSARSLSLSSRGKLADRGTVYTSKVRAASGSLWCTCSRSAAQHNTHMHLVLGRQHCVSAFGIDHHAFRTGTLSMTGAKADPGLCFAFPGGV